MCGIFAYIGKRPCVETAISGLKRLEYRGYDSAGMAGFIERELVEFKEVGKVALLEKILKDEKPLFDLAIAHTRWATHGKPSHYNAHPHFDSFRQVALVHNGIVENDEELRASLQQKGLVFASETDTEVIAQLIANFYEGDILQAIQQAVQLMRGAFAVVLLHRDYPGKIFAFAHHSPLVIGLGENEVFFSSDPHAFANYTKDVLFLESDEIAVAKMGSVEIFDASLKKVNRSQEKLPLEFEETSKGEFDHYTLKEINEQPQAIINALMGRLEKQFGTANFHEISFNLKELPIERVLILGCGTSWHAGCFATYLLEEVARLPVEVEIASEFRYKNPILSHKTLVIAISQSGETADTIACVREIKAKGARVLAICNVPGSTLARLADDCLYLRAGIEIGVCSTKAFVNQIVVLSLLTLLLARVGDMSKEEGQRLLEGLEALPQKVQTVLDRADQIAAVGKKYAACEKFFFIGRHYMYPTCLEAALKLKEISYINANAYPAGELKHGPIALIDSDSVVIAFCANHKTFDKLVSNMQEVKARGCKVVAIISEDSPPLNKIADDCIFVPSVSDEMAIIPASVAAQLFAYYIALERGTNIDQPRNLAKSVTVE